MKVRRLGRFFALAAGLALVLLPAVPAHAGGGCHDSVIRDVAGTRVDLKDNCFTETILRVQPNQGVTWTNRDSIEHSVTGVGGTWGTYDAVRSGESVTYRFSRAGVYPYFCYIHPGMVGAVVVGDGGKASTTQSAGAGVLPVISKPSNSSAAAPATKPQAVRTPESSPGPWRTVALVTIGILVAAGTGLAAQRFTLRRFRVRARVG